MNLHRLIILLMAPFFAAAIPEIVFSSQDPSDALNISFAGSASGVISDEEISILELSDARLINAAEAHMRARPASVYLRDPTPWGFKYNEFKWPEVQCRLSVLNVTYSFSDETPRLAYRKIENRAQSPTDLIQNIMMNSSEENTIRSEWWGMDTRVFQKRVRVGFRVAGGQFSYTSTHSWGEGQVSTQTIALRISTTVNVVVPPGESVYIELIGIRRRLHVDIDYLAELSGRAFLNYPRQHNGHHFHGVEINQMLRSGGYPISAITTESMDLGFIVDARLRMTTLNSLMSLPEIPVQIEYV